jgi:hypothetical protein
MLLLDVWVLANNVVSLLGVHTPNRGILMMLPGIVAGLVDR